MFYARINKIKVFNNREGFLGLFNNAELRIYSFASDPTGHVAESGLQLTVADLIGLDEGQRREALLDAVIKGAGQFAQSNTLSVDRVRDNQSLTFGDAGFVVYQGDRIPDALSLQLWVIESDEDVRRFTFEADKVLESDAFKGLLIAVETALTVTNPVLSGIIGVGAVVTNLLRGKLKANRDDLVGYWLQNLNRPEHYPHALRDRQDTPDTTGNMLVDYTLFGFENEI
jgi:hypothetical protein